MKTRTFTKLSLFSAAFAGLLGVAASASGGSLPIQVTVFDAAEKVAFKGPLRHDSTFSTQNLPSGRYVVQFNSRTTAVKGQHYFLAISAGHKKVIADGVAGELLAGGGAAMRVEVGREMRITGQIVRDDGQSLPGIAKSRMIDGRRYVWVETQLGSHVGGRWVEATLAPVNNLVTVRMDDFRKAQDQAGEGSMLKGYGNYIVLRGDSY